MKINFKESNRLNDIGIKYKYLKCIYPIKAEYYYVY